MRSLEPASRARPMARRIVWAAVILLVAVGMMYWGTTREQRRIDEVEHFVRRAVETSVAGDAASFGRTERVLAHAVRSRIAGIISALPDAAGLLHVDVRSGDAAPQDGFAHPLVTHTAILSVGVPPDGEPILGLRIHHDADPAEIMIVGMFEPDEF